MIHALPLLAVCAFLIFSPLVLAGARWYLDQRPTRGYCCQTCERWFPRGYHHYCVVARLGRS